MLIIPMVIVNYSVTTKNFIMQSAGRAKILCSFVRARILGPQGSSPGSAGVGVEVRHFQQESPDAANRT